MADRTPQQRRRTAVILCILAAGFGCNPLLAPFKLLNINKARLQSKHDFYERTRKTKDRKDIKVAVLTSRSRSLSPETFGAERTLSNMFIATLKAAFASNKERVTVLPASEVDKFKQQHEDWQVMDWHEIAQHLGVDYLIDLELTGLTLYEPGSRQLFRGSCHASVRVYDSDPNAESPMLFTDTVSLEFPGGGVVVAADQEMNVEKFQSQFMARVAVELTALFTGIETRQRFQ